MGKNEPTLSPVTIMISGEHDSGRTTLANLIKGFLEENEYRHVSLKDVEPLPADEKDRFSERFTRNRYLRAVNIYVVLAEVGPAAVLGSHDERASMPLFKSIHG